MDFWNEYDKRRAENGFGSGQLVLNTGERYILSLQRFQERSVELPMNRAISLDYSEERRYLIVRDLTFDLFASIYDVNSKHIVAMRMSAPLASEGLERFRKATAPLKRPKFEFRAIGMQDNDTTLVNSIIEIRKAAKTLLVEADLFGNQTRHLIIDLLTGKPCSLLLLNRIYRPGELINQAKKEDFDRLRAKVNFV